jgi:hypothetical protein
MTRQPVYLAYMLRLWQSASSDDEPGWRASVENPHTGERHGFANLEQLVEFLREKTDYLVTEELSKDFGNAKTGRPSDLDGAGNKK